MRRIDLRVLLVLPLLSVVSACGDDPVAAPAPVASAPASSAAPEPSEAESEPPDPVESSEYVEEDDEPSAEPGDLPGEAQSYLDEALGTELSALATAPPAEATERQKTLDKLPENSTEVLTALRGYDWFSADARKSYEQAVKAAG